MGAATVHAYYFNSTGPTATDVDGGTLKFNREDTQSGTSGTIPIPTAGTSGATSFSWPKFLGLYVTVAGTTTISNRGIKQGSSTATGLKLHFKDSATYTQPAAGQVTDDANNNAVTPSGFTLMTTSNQTYHAAGVSSAGTGLNGDYVQIVLGVSATNSYVGGPGSAIALPTLVLQYDEA